MLIGSSYLIILSTVSLHPFWNILATGRWLILLDGFDEIAPDADASERANYIYSLHPLLASASPVILTCEPSYFMSAAEYNNILLMREDAHGSLVHTAARMPAPESPAQTGLGNLLYRKGVSPQFARELPATGSSSITLRPLRPEHINEYLATHNSQFMDALHVNWQGLETFLWPSMT